MQHIDRMTVSSRSTLSLDDQFSIRSEATPNLAIIEATPANRLPW